MTLQGILFILGIVFLLAAAGCAGVVAWLYFKRNIRDIHDDLTGKKRAKIIAEMDELTPSNRLRQHQARSPVTAAAEAAASVARHAAEGSTDMSHLQPTVAPKPKAAEPDSSGEHANDAPEAEAPATVVGNDAGETIVSIGGGADEEETTMVAGIEARTPSEETGQESKTGLASIQVVRKIVLADSDDFIRIGRQGEGDA